VDEPEEQQGAGFETGQRRAREDEIARAEATTPQVGKAEFRKTKSGGTPFWRGRWWFSDDAEENDEEEGEHSDAD
jgi:hypothetical protein